MADRSEKTMAKEKTISIWDPKIMSRAGVDSLRKLNPVTMMKNPVMFVVEVGSVITTILLLLWFTVLFANFAEAMAEGRGKAQADNLRKARTETTARRLLPDGQTEV